MREIGFTVENVVSRARESARTRGGRMTSAIARLNDFGQSPWYDNITRTLVREGGLAKLIDEDGIRGVTSNPTIFDKAIGGGEGYDEQLLELHRQGVSAEDAFWALAVDDIGGGADLLRPIYDRARPGRRLHLDRGVAAARARHPGDDRAGGGDLRTARPAEHPHQDPGHARGHPRHRGDDRRGHQRQRHVDLQPRPSRGGHRGVPQGARALRRRRRRPGRRELGRARSS